MRIFTAVRHARNPRQFYGGLWSANFYPALRGMGHELVESQVDLAPASRFMDVTAGFTLAELALRARLTEQVLSEVEAAHRQRPIELFLSYFYNAHFDAAAFARLRALGIPSINFYCNSIHQFANVAEIAAKVDVSWHAERDARSSYLRVGANPVWVQMAADPEVYQAIQSPKKPVACFVGQNYADRASWMAALIHADIPIELYGPGWGVPQPVAAGSAPESEGEYLGRPQPVPGSAAGYSKAIREILARDGVIQGAKRIATRIANRNQQGQHADLLAAYAQGAIPFNQMIEVFGRSAVCLNFSNVWLDGPGSQLVAHVRLRDFEGPMCRTCYLTGHTDEISEFYEVGREIDTYRTTEELIDKIRFYLAHPDAAERLRDGGHRRAVSSHTWTHRFTELFAKTRLAVP
jgi:spore maturation protein CgeB